MCAGAGLGGCGDWHARGRLDAGGAAARLLLQNRYARTRARTRVETTRESGHDAQRSTHSHTHTHTHTHTHALCALRAAEEIGAAIFVHPWDMMGSNLMKDYFLPWLVGMPAETSLAICSMMFSGLFERYPRLRVCFAHGGGSFPGTLARVQHGFDVRPDLCAKDCTRSPVEQCGSFWTDSLVHDPHALRDIVRIFGEDKVCLGTDYPFPLGEYTAESRGKEYAAGALIDSMEWAAGQKEKLLGSNACAWLNRDIVDFWK
ncbi:hypothetical protein EON67_07095 [archaeon]|nr:MAG: hypothetical protein EON67_07095 [archaeon]